MTLSNQTLWLGAIYEMTLAGLSSVRFVTWQTAVALRLGGSGQHCGEPFSGALMKGGGEWKAGSPRSFQSLAMTRIATPLITLAGFESFGRI